MVGITKELRLTLLLTTLLATLLGGAHPAAGEERIIGGTPAAITDAPWQVAILDSGVAADWYAQFCGGSVIAADWVLTAAHCVVDGGVTSAPGSLAVLAGRGDLSTDSATSGPRTAVDRVIPHPGYVGSTHENDVALLHLSPPLAINGTTIATIGLPRDLSPSLWPALGVNGRITGWGNTSAAGSSYPTQLQQTTVQILAGPLSAVCGSYSSDSYLPQVMLCAGAALGGKDTCQGDSGGPLAVGVGGTWVLAGVTSFGTGCALAAYPGVYSRVTTYTGWIDDVMSPPAALDTPLLDAQGVTAAWTDPLSRPASGCSSHQITWANTRPYGVRAVRFTITAPDGSRFGAATESDVAAGATGSWSVDTCSWEFTNGDGPYVFRLEAERHTADGGTVASARGSVTFVADSPTGGGGGGGGYVPTPTVPSPDPAPAAPQPAPTVTNPSTVPGPSTAAAAPSRVPWVKARAMGERVRLRWSAAAGSVSSYTVQVGQRIGWRSVKSVDSATTSWTWRGTRPGRTYVFRVAAVGEGGRGPWTTSRRVHVD